jgi:hypothetical protein
MKDVIAPDISAGSNQVGARETCKPQVSCAAEAGAAASVEIAALKPRAGKAKICRRPKRVWLPPCVE